MPILSPLQEDILRKLAVTIQKTEAIRKKFAMNSTTVQGSARAACARGELMRFVALKKSKWLAKHVEIRERGMKMLLVIKDPKFPPLFAVLVSVGVPKDEPRTPAHARTAPKKMWLVPTQAALFAEEVEGEWGTEERPYALAYIDGEVFLGVADYVSASRQARGFTAHVKLTAPAVKAPDEPLVQPVAPPVVKSSVKKVSDE